ncbi:MAG: acyltransferase domain-containing protein [Gammaproteobacteria bacterium]|nr:acyltransferase domain-containing protein [Gammaproteobacteria bacterium]
MAVAQACQNLIDYRCDMAIAGAASINGRGPRGYMSEIEGMTSPRGICAPLDASADGSVFGDGVGAVVLKRLSDARADNDPVRAVLRGWAVGNDGNDRAGFASPGVTGQMETVIEAIVMAEAEPSNIGYVELHGSATRVGDPIEVSALHRAFSNLGSAAPDGCALGSVKGNLGHLDAAAGIIGLIKAVLVVAQGQRPPIACLPHPLRLGAGVRRVFFHPLSVSPFARRRRLAGISSFGLGGTNAHVVLENADDRSVRPDMAPDGPISLVLSASSKGALRRQLERLIEMAAAPNAPLADAATTLLNGRAALPLRIAVAGRDWGSIGERAACLAQAIPEPAPAAPDRPVIFAMTGTGLHYRGMVHALTGAEPVFRDALDDLRRIAQRDHRLSLDWLTVSPADPEPALDLKALLRGKNGTGKQAGLSICAIHAGIVAVQMALTALLADRGLRPDRVMGHSLGEFAACHAAGMLAPEAVLATVVTRARLIENLPEGGMLSVPVTPEAAEAYCYDGVWIGAFNAPGLVTLCARADRLDALETELRAAGHMYRRLDSARAYHSPDLAPAADPLARALAPLSYADPAVPLVSNLSGEVLDPEALHNGRYWADHMVKPVQWARSVASQLDGPAPVFVEIGPGSGLGQLIDAVARDAGRACTTVATIPGEHDAVSGDATLQDALGAVWAAGRDMPASALVGSGATARTHLWTYPFERDKYWIDPPAMDRAAANSGIPATTVATAAAPPKPSPERATGIKDSFRAIFSGFFGRDDLGFDEDLIALGGHSLLALQISNAIWKSHRIEVPVRSILKERTLRRILDSIDLNGALASAGSEDEPGDKFPARLSGQSLTSRIQTLERWVMDRMSGIGQAAELHPDSIFGAADMSLAIPDLIRSVQRDLGLRMFPNEFAGSLTVHQIALHILSALDLDAAPASEVPRAVPSIVASRDRVPKTVFVLSSVRSGSTLLRVMLAGHPGLFAPPELHLARYADMQERARFETSPDRDQGLVVALTDLYDGNRARAEAATERFTTEAWPTAEVFRFLQQAAAPRLLVDKSPGNANDPRTLERLETLFEAPRYLHLYRHPYSVIESVSRNRFTALMRTPGLDPEELGDYLWHRSNANITEFLGAISDERAHAVSYEDLVTDPERSTRQICAALGVDYVPALLAPYDGKRMRDGLGDPNLSNHSHIRPDLADAWRRKPPVRRLSPQTATLARDFGYDLLARDLPRPQRTPVIDVRARISRLCKEHVETVVLRPEQRANAPALVCLHPLDGSVDLYRALADTVPVDGLVIGLGLTRDAAKVTDWTIPELARIHAEALRRHGPASFELLGWSFGGLVAFEIAQILKRPAPVTVLDTPAPFNRGQRAEESHRIMMSFAETLFATFKKLIPEGLSQRLSAAPNEDAVIDRAIDALVTAEILPDSMYRSDFADRFRIFRANTVAANRFERKAKGGQLRLLRAHGTSSGTEVALVHPNFGHADGMYGWSTIADVVDAQNVTGTHHTMLSHAHVGAISEHMQQHRKTVAS